MSEVCLQQYPGEEYDPVDPDVSCSVEELLVLLRSVPGMLSEPDRVSPMPDGSLVLEWQEPSLACRYVEIDVDAPYEGSLMIMRSADDVTHRTIRWSKTGIEWDVK